MLEPLQLVCLSSCTDYTIPGLGVAITLAKPVMPPTLERAMQLTLTALCSVL